MGARTVDSVRTSMRCTGPWRPNESTATCWKPRRYVPGVIARNSNRPSVSVTNDRTPAIFPGAGTSASCTTAPVSGRIAIESNTTPVTRAPGTGLTAS
jgi:hypothetical protein